MGAMASQITSLKIVYSTVYSSGDQTKHQSSTPPAFVREIHRWQMARNAEDVSIWWRHHDFLVHGDSKGGLMLTTVLPVLNLS